MTFALNDFWKRRLSTTARATNTAVKGWQHVTVGLESFLEAPMRLAQGFGDANPDTGSVLLVSAPGAVGKSTFAKQLAFETGALFVDLAETGRVGANFVVGGLAKTGLFAAFNDGATALVIDGLDEARISLTQASMSDFLKDVAELAAPTRKPIVLLGRTGAVQEAWLLLDGHGIEAPVLEIEYYDQASALEFAKIQAQIFRQEQQRREPDGRAIELILHRLSEHTHADGNAFVGYAPVLIAIAKQVADPDDPRNENTQALIKRVESGSSMITLETIAEDILRREQGKLHRLNLDDQTLQGRLYEPAEQLDCLIARLYKVDKQPNLPSMSAADQEKYSNALETWVAEHPFLD